MNLVTWSRFTLGLRSGPVYYIFLRLWCMNVESTDNSYNTFIQVTMSSGLPPGK